MTWKYHTMMYADRYPIQFRQNVVSGEIQMRVDDAMAKAKRLCRPRRAESVYRGERPGNNRSRMVACR